MRRPANTPLAHWRRVRGLSTPKLGQLAGTTQQTITKLEHGQRELTDDWAAKLAPLLGCKPSDLKPPLDGGPNPQEVQLLAIFRNLSEDDRDRMIKMAAALQPTTTKPRRG